MEVYNESIEGQCAGTTYNNNYKIFVPENVNENTEVIFYTCNTVFDEEMQQDILNNNSNSIIIVTNNTPAIVGGEPGNGTNLFQDGAINMFNIIRDRYDLKTTNYTQAGFSSGYGYAIRTVSQYINQNPDCGRQVIISVDGCESQTPGGFHIYDSEYDTLRENNTIIISYAQQNRHNHEIGFLKNSGLPMLFVVDPSVEEQSGQGFNYLHDLVANNFTERELYQVLNDWALGKAELPEGYIYEVYNPTTGNIETMNRDEVSAFFGVNVYETKINQIKLLNNLTIEDMTITSNKQTLLSCTNEIFSNIKNSDFVNNGMNFSSGFTSTTKVPSAIGEVVKSFYTANANLMLKIANDIQNIVTIGEAIEKQDEELKNETIELGNVETNQEEANTNQTQQPDEPVVENIINTNQIIQQNQTQQNNQENNQIEQNNQENNQIQQNNNTTEKTEETNKENNETEENNQNVTSEPETTNEQNNVITQETEDETDKTGQQNNGANNNYVSNNNSQVSNENKNPLDEFPEFHELYSDETKIVYEHTDGYRLIIHKDGDEIIGIEHYYKFENENLANSAFDELSSKYEFDNNIENIIQKDNYIKVIFKNETFENLTINDIRNKYKDLNEIREM